MPLVCYLLGTLQRPEKTGIQRSHVKSQTMSFCSQHHWSLPVSNHLPDPRLQTIRQLPRRLGHHLCAVVGSILQGHVIELTIVHTEMDACTILLHCHNHGTGRWMHYSILQHWHATSSQCMGTHLGTCFIRRLLPVIIWCFTTPVPTRAAGPTKMSAYSILLLCFSKLDCNNKFITGVITTNLPMIDATTPTALFIFMSS